MDGPLFQVEQQVNFRIGTRTGLHLRLTWWRRPILDSIVALIEMLFSGTTRIAHWLQTHGL